MSRRRTFSMTFGLLVAGFGLLTACNPSAAQEQTAESAAQSPTAVQNSLAASVLKVDLSEWAIALNRTAVNAGQLTIAAANRGQLPHDLVVLRGGPGIEPLPIVDGQVDESKVTIVNRFREFKAGEKEKQFTLEKGSYLLICNLPAHYLQGMVTHLVVE